MSNISVHVRLRPVRFAFLVRPDDHKRVLEIFRVNTCLWGGKYNPIIPSLKQVPKWWDRNNHHFETAAQIVNGYLDFFEPDFIVEAESGLTDGLGFSKKRILQLSDLLIREGDRGRKGQGLSVLNLYSDLYHKEFQFARRHEHNIVNVIPEKLIFSGFCACLFGAFPAEPDLAYFSRDYIDVFDPKKVSLNGASLANLYKTGFTSALRLGHTKIEVDYHDHNDPALFILDAQNPRDLIDYWNLRAVSRHVIPVPVQWLGDLSEFCKDFIIKNHRPLPGNPNGVMIRATVMFARSIPTDEIDRLYTDHFRVDVDGANVRQDWYPSIWRPSPGFTDRQMRPTLSAAEKTFDTPLISDKPEIRFDCLHPEFADEFGNENRWANVVSLSDWSFKDQIATVFPCDFRNPTFPDFRRAALDKLLPTTEGIVIFPRHRNIPERWEIPDGTTAINKWLKTNGITAVLSDAGRSTQQIIQTLGGFGGVASFAHAEIVKLLNEISRRPISRSAHHKEFKNRINNVTKDDIWRNRNFENLVQQGAVELGLELKCSKCSSWSWYSLKQLDYNLNCGLCLRDFGFPITDPSASSNSKWAYRLVGPFALPDYARGGYAASLSIRFFSDCVGQHDRAVVTWSAGQELELGPKNKVESDFILWYQRKQFFGNNYPTEIVFGEAKSFGKDAFQADDVERMKSLATRFPGSILVFSTMKQADEISKAEIARIAKLAEWGREYIRERRQTRAPVIILTGRELFAPYSLEEAWKSIGGKHAQLIEPGMVRAENLRVLANLTQQLYLNMPSYWVWSEARWKVRAARREARSSKISDTHGTLITE